MQYLISGSRTVPFTVSKTEYKSNVYLSSSYNKMYISAKHLMYMFIKLPPKPTHSKALFSIPGRSDVIVAVHQMDVH